MSLSNSNGSTYNPVAYAQDAEWLEWVAAMYESAAADADYVAAFAWDRRPESTNDYATWHAGGYADAAMRVAEESEAATLERLAESWA